MEIRNYLFKPTRFRIDLNIYFIPLSKDEKLKIDKRVEISREKFKKGYVTGTTVGLALFSFYGLWSILTPGLAYASDLVPGPGPGPNQIKPRPNPVLDTSKGTFLGGASGVYLSAQPSGNLDFLLGLGFSGLLIVWFIIMNRDARHRPWPNQLNH